MISDYIFDECATIILSKLKDRNEAINRIARIKEISMIKIDEHIFEESWRIFKDKNRDKLLLSFTDCSSIALVKISNLNGIATFDNDFKKVEGVKVFS